MLNNQFVDFKNVESNIDYIFELPDNLLDNVYSNPYSNVSLNIPNGKGFLDLVLETNDASAITYPGDVQLASGTALDRATYVAKLLIVKGGFTKELAAAIAGTCIDENGCNPASYMKAEAAGKGSSSTRGNNNYGAGIGSWTGVYKKKVLLQAGYSPNTKIENLTLDLLIDLLIIDSQTGMKKYYDALKRCKTIEDASATSVLITGGVGKSKNWGTHPTQEEAKRLSDWYGASNDKRYGKSKYHWNLDVRRLNYSKQVLSRL